MTGALPSRRRWLKLVGALALLLVLFAILFPSSNTVMRHTEYCTGCIAYRITKMNGFWFDGHRLLALGVTEEIQESAVLREVHGGHHEHHWANNGASGSFFGLRTFIACDHPRWNPMAHWLEVDGSFRAATLKSVADGKLARETLLAILELPGEPTAADAETPARQALFARGQELLRGTRFGESPHWASALASANATGSPVPR